MAWIAADKDTSLFLYKNKPIRKIRAGIWISRNNGPYYSVKEKLLKDIFGLTLNWKDEPIEITFKINNHENIK